MTDDRLKSFQAMMESLLSKAQLLQPAPPQPPLIYDGRSLVNLGVLLASTIEIVFHDESVDFHLFNGETVTHDGHHARDIVTWMEQTGMKPKDGKGPTWSRMVADA